MRRTISGSGRGAYNSTIAAAARTVRKTNSNNGNPENAAVARTNSNSSGSSAAVTASSGSGSGNEDSRVAVDRSLQKTTRTNADDSGVVSNAAAAEGAEAVKRDSSLSKQLLKTASSNAAAVYQQNLVIRTMRKTTSGFGASRAAFKV